MKKEITNKITKEVQKKATSIFKKNISKIKLTRNIKISIVVLIIILIPIIYYFRHQILKLLIVEEEKYEREIEKEIHREIIIRDNW